MGNDWQFVAFHAGTLDDAACIIVETIEPVVNPITATVDRHQLRVSLHCWDRRDGLVRQGEASDPDSERARKKLEDRFPLLRIRWGDPPA